MNSFVKIQPSPFRFLLYTEWIMLASCGLLAMVEAFEEQYLPLQHIFILLVLAVMGLRLPTGKQQVQKILYTFISFGLIFYGTALGYLHILPTLYLIAVIRSCFIFKTPGRYAIAGLAFVLFLAHQVQYANSISQYVLQGEQHRFWMHQLAEVLMFGLGLLFVLQLVNTLLAERQIREELTDAHEQLQYYALEIEDLAVMRDRNRIAHDIHDTLGHSLTALNVQLQTALKLWEVNGVEAWTFLKQAQRLGEMAMKEVRKSVGALRTNARNEEPPLKRAIALLIEDFRQETGVNIDTEIHLNTVLPYAVVNSVYRITKEALTNICKHAQATKVRIKLDTDLHSVSFTVEDNGRGFWADSNTTGLGLQNIRDRTTALKGNFRIDSEPGFGCRISVELPLQEFSAVKMGNGRGEAFG